MPVRHLPVGAPLFDAAAVSPYLAGIFLGDTLLWEPWLRARTLDGQTGWVFGGAVAPVGLTAEQTAQWRQRKRMQALFGPDHTQRLLEWAETTLLTDTAVAQHLQQGLALREALENALRYGLRRPNPEAQPNLRWLNDYLRYMRLYRGGIALDFNLLGQMARQTVGEEDDCFAHLGQYLYPLDSMESPLPIWVFALSWTESVSNLGSGQHRAALQRMGDALQRAPLFRSEIERFKRALLEDILDDQRAYWQALPRLLAELDQILAEPPTCLNEQERAALQLRRAMLAQGRARTDLRSGR